MNYEAVIHSCEFPIAFGEMRNTLEVALSYRFNMYLGLQKDYLLDSNFILEIILKIYLQYWYKNELWNQPDF